MNALPTTLAGIEAMTEMLARRADGLDDRCAALAQRNEVDTTALVASLRRFVAARPSSEPTPLQSPSIQQLIDFGRQLAHYHDAQAIRHALRLAGVRDE